MGGRFNYSKLLSLLMLEPLATIPESLQPKFDKLWRAACRVCDNIHAFQPELLLALMHSGWGPVFAAQIIWQQTQSLPFPPVARTNLGREKIDVFEADTLGEITGSFVGEYSPEEDIEQFLAWINQRADWRAQLRQQTVDAMQNSRDPQRILVVDDCFHEGSTFILTTGLVKSVYPQATVRFLNAHGWYRWDYLRLMLEVLGPQAEAFPMNELHTDELSRQLGWVAIGSEDISQDSLYWQPISLNSPSVQALSGYRSPAEWVQISQAVYATIAGYITKRAPTYQPNEPDSHDYSVTGTIPCC